MQSMEILNLPIKLNMLLMYSMETVCRAVTSKAVNTGLISTTPESGKSNQDGSDEFHSVYAGLLYTGLCGKITVFFNGGIDESNITAVYG